ncbi:MAG: DUF3277 family protein [Clostridiales bacterium]|nr:DUF3277 family protein [Clostridiales bacterium]
MVKTYDPKQILISLGSHVVTGYSDSSFVSIEASGDGVTKKTGCDGEVIRSIDPDSTAKITLTVLQQSPTVGYVQQQYDKDRATGDGMFPVLVKDLKGGLVFSAENAWVVKPPNREFDREAPDREIEIDTGEATWEGENI